MIHFKPLLANSVPRVMALENEGEWEILPHLEALEWMRLRALERLAFQYNDLRDTWLSRESTVEEEKAYVQGRMDSVNRGIDEMIAALIEGRVSTASEAFAQFEDYTSLKQLDNFLKHEAPFYLAPIQWGYQQRIEKGGIQKPQNGQGFRNLLQANDVDVDGLIRFSELKSSEDREAWLLSHVKHLRDEPYTSGLGYPAQTIVAILEQLIESENPKVKRDAQVLYGNVSGATALTGFSDAAWAVQSRDGGKSAATMAAAMLVAGPLGAWVEGHAALGTVTLAGRSLWQGSRAGEVGFFAKFLGFGTEATAFWAGNDVLQASFVGGAEYFTGHGLASSFLMLGGLRALGAAYAIGCGHALARAADETSLYCLKLGYSLLNRTGQVMTEWAGFWGLGQLEELIGLAPIQDSTLRQELAQAGLSLLQVKTAVSAGKAVTGDLSTIKTLEIKLDTARNLFAEAQQRGAMPLEAADAAFARLTHLQEIVNHLQGLEPAYAMARNAPIPADDLTRPMARAAEEERGASSRSSERILKDLRERMKSQLVLKDERDHSGNKCYTLQSFLEALQHLSAEGLPEGLCFRLSVFISKDTVSAPTFRSTSDTQPTSTHYLTIDFQVIDGKLRVTGLGKYYHSLALEVLRENKNVDLAEYQGEAALIVMEEQLCQQLILEEKNGHFQYYTLQSFLEALQHLSAEGLPEGLCFGLSVFISISKDTVLAPTFRSKSDTQPTSSHYLNVDFQVIDGKLQVTALGKHYRYLALKTLRENKNVDLEKYRGEAEIIVIEEQFFEGLKRAGCGWPVLSIGDFEARLAALSVDDLLDGLIVGMSALPVGEKVKNTVFRSSDAKRPIGQYLHIDFRVVGGKLVVEAVDGARKGEFYQVLKQNPNMRFSPFLWVEYAEPAAKERLLLHLSEYGRQALLNQFQALALGAGASEIGFRLAARWLLLDYAEDYTRDPGWEPRDPRWAVALELNRYLATERFSEAEATALSVFIQAAREREFERQMGDYDRARRLRLAGSAPISESGWDLVFSPELREGLRAFAAEYAAVATTDPSRDLLRDPYNEILGAYYWRLLETDHAAERWEIVSHLYAQRRRGDFLKEFYDGMIKASGRSEAAVHLRIQNELRLLEQSRTAWEMDQEAPFRLTEPGIIGGAARFLWTEIYGPNLRDGLISGARELFPRHRDEFAPDIDLSERLPQALFFEVVGHEAAKRLKEWNAGVDTTYARGIDVLELMLGLGDESVMGFRAGFGEGPSPVGPSPVGALRKPLTDLCQGLMRMDEVQFRAYLESSVTYARNVVDEQGHYQARSVSMRRGEVLENLLRGYGLREMTGTVRSFRFLGSGDAAAELARVSEIYEKLTGDIPESPSDAERRWLFALLDLYTSDFHSDRAWAREGDRWYKFEQWLLENPEREGLLLEEVR